MRHVGCSSGPRRRIERKGRKVAWCAFLQTQRVAMTHWGILIVNQQRRAGLWAGFVTNRKSVPENSFPAVREHIIAGSWCSMVRLLPWTRWSGKKLWGFTTRSWAKRGLEATRRSRRLAKESKTLSMEGNREFRYVPYNKISVHPQNGYCLLLPIVGLFWPFSR